MLLHGYQWHGLWTGMHAYSGDGGNTFALSQRRDGRGAFSTNQSYQDGGWETFYRRERPELRFDTLGNPSVFYSGVQYANCNINANLFGNFPLEMQRLCGIAPEK